MPCSSDDRFVYIPKNTIRSAASFSPDADIDLTASRKRTRSQSAATAAAAEKSPAKKGSSHCDMNGNGRSRWASPRKCTAGREKEHGHAEISTVQRLLSSPKSPNKLPSTQLSQKPKWNPRDPVQMQTVKEALHVATSPNNVVCRDEEQKRVLDFCKACIEQEKGGSMYVCGCPGTGKTLSIGKVQECLRHWSKQVGLPAPYSLAINCTSLARTTEIFSKILAKTELQKKTSNSVPPLQDLQNLFSEKGFPYSRRMMLLVVDEMDYLVTTDRAVLHDLFMLTTLPFSKCILIGIANAIDLADRFLPKLESLNCKPVVVTFPAYSKDQILTILQQRLKILGCDVFQPLALEFCARKVAAASGDMRRALAVCRSAIEVLEAQLRNATEEQEIETVTFDHMDIALSKAFKSAVLDTIQSLPQHQQIILCSLVKLFQQCKKNVTTLGELHRSYLEICKSTQIPPVGTMEFTNMCRVLSDQGLLQLGQSKENKSKTITLKVDSSDVNFAFKFLAIDHPIRRTQLDRIALAKITPPLSKNKRKTVFIHN